MATVLFSQTMRGSREDRAPADEGEMEGCRGAAQLMQLHNWSAARSRPCPPAFYHELVLQQERRTPYSTARCLEGRDQITYRALCDGARLLAAALRQACVRAGFRVGLLTVRGLEMAVGMMGILFADAGYGGSLSAASKVDKSRRLEWSKLPLVVQLEPASKGKRGGVAVKEVYSLGELSRDKLVLWIKKQIGLMRNPGASSTGYGSKSKKSEPVCSQFSTHVMQVGTE